MKKTKTVVLPVKYKKEKRFNKDEIVNIGEQETLFSKKKFDTVIFLKSGDEYYIDMPVNLVKKLVSEE